MEKDAILLVADGVGGYWWVVATKILDRSEVSWVRDNLPDLLRNELSLSSLINPLAQE